MTKCPINRPNKDALGRARIEMYPGRFQMRIKSRRMTFVPDSQTGRVSRPGAKSETPIRSCRFCE